MTLARLTIWIAALASTAAAAEIQPGNCAKAAKYSDSKKGVSVLVIQNDRTVFEHYANGGMPQGRWPIFSGTKSFWGTTALCAVRDGLLKLDDRVADTITEWKADPLKSQITIRQLLNQTDGIDGASWLHRQSIPDRNAMAIHCASVAAPGTRFIYGPSHFQIFCELLRRKLSGRSAISYIQENILSPLGLTNMEFKQDGRGNPLLASGFELTANEWARFGLMIMQDGAYGGRQIVPAALLGQAFVGSNANPAYGLTFWLNRQASSFFSREIDIEKEIDLPWQRARWNNICVCRGAPPDMIVALGSAYQRLFIIPSAQAVIVRQGRDAKFSDAYFLRLVLGR